MATKAVHIRDTRLFNNAGISFPVCQVGDKPLDTDKCRWTTAQASGQKATCKACIKRVAVLYPWAGGSWDGVQR